jgi:hypothetical protein
MGELSPLTLSVSTDNNTDFIASDIFKKSKASN